MLKVGRWYSSIVYQNVGIFITLGLIRITFGNYGWWPNKDIFSLYNSTLLYFAPCILAYTGGRLFGGQRGAIVAAMSVFALTMSSQDPMIIGAMILGPLLGFLYGYLDSKLKKWIPSGFELFFNNLFVGLFTLVFMVISYLFIGSLLTEFMNLLLQWMDLLVQTGLLPLVAIIIEPLKVLFLNNLINHGFIAPLGIEQAKETGKSIYFLLEDNPGPGLGILLAYSFIMKGDSRKNSLYSAVIHFFGGIHEIYFPYVLRNPVLILSTILGGMVGDYCFETLRSGIVSISSPGSILLFILFSPRGALIGNLTGVILSAVVSFGTAVLLLKLKKEQHIRTDDKVSLFNFLGEIEAEMKQPLDLKNNDDHLLNSDGTIQHIVFACEAGMGSSALGAAILKKQFRKEKLQIDVTHCSVDRIPVGADCIITHRRFEETIKKDHPGKVVFVLDSFVDEEEYKALTNTIQLLNNQADQDHAHNLQLNQIVLDAKAENEFEAIRLMGQRMVSLGLVSESYILEMIEREKKFSTYLGKGLAIPHGTSDKSHAVIKPGVVIALFPEGVLFDGNLAHIVVGIAGYAEKQVELLALLAHLLDDDEAIDRLKTTNDKHVILDVLRQFGL